MSAPGDVLADLAELIARDEEQQDYCSEPCANEAMGRVVKLQAIRSAVAELIAADREYDAAKAHRIEADNSIVSGDKSDGAFIRQARARHAYDRAVDRRRAALARVGAA